MQQHQSQNLFPQSQRELIRSARGNLTQKDFAKMLGVERSCLSRYESEKLGAPTKVLNHCLSAITAQMNSQTRELHRVEQALAHARQAVSLLESASTNVMAPNPESAE